MPRLKMPVTSGARSDFPDRALCPWCQKNKVLEPHSFAYIGGGALFMDRIEDSGGPHEDMEGYLYLAWHGGHPEEGGEGGDPNIEAHVQIADGVLGGQYGLYFCSTNCLRAFLNYCVDKLEQKLERKRRQKAS
jgi:hypothetical protein